MKKIILIATMILAACVSVPVMADDLDNILSSGRQAELGLTNLSQEQRDQLADEFLQVYLLGGQAQFHVMASGGSFTGKLTGFDGLNFTFLVDGQTYKIPSIKVFSIW